MKILVIFTGGTIGSTVKNGWILNDSTTNYALINNYFEKTNDTDVEFDTYSPYTVLSENLTAEHINKLIECINENTDKGYDGIIVTHGTDTLQYTAAALSYSAISTIPIVLVSSDYPLEDSRANGNANFYAAVKFIEAGLGYGVFVSYKNAKEDEAFIHAATRMTQYTEASASLYSVDDEPYAFCGSKVRLNPAYILSQEGGKLGNTQLCDAPGILVIESRPGDNFTYNLEHCEAVILRPYHSGTLNTDNAALKKLCREAKSRNIPVFLINVKSGTSYASTKSFAEMGMEILPLCSFSAIYVKCWMAISRGEDIPSFVKKPIAQEFVY